MAKEANVTVRVKTSTKARLETLARAINRSKSFVIEEALEQYLDVNEWQIKGIEDALADADGPNAEWTDHKDVLTKLEGKLANKVA